MYDDDERPTDRFTSFTSPLHSLKLSGNEEDTLKTELDDLYALLLKDPVYESLSSVEEAVVILSKREPHIILHCSKAMEVLLGASAKDIFGTSLASLTAIVTDEYLGRRSVVPQFFQQMRSQYGRSHTLVNIIHKNQNISDSYQECSITSFPICQGMKEESNNNKNTAEHNVSRADEEEAAALLRDSGHNSCAPRKSSSRVVMSSGQYSSTPESDEMINYFGLLVTPLKSKRNIEL
jgi:hypothetical protein